MVLLHTMGAAAAMQIRVTCPHCKHSQQKMRSRSGRYVCTHCHRTFGRMSKLQKLLKRDKR